MLAIIANYYNPNNDLQRLNNYINFLKNINSINLYTIELDQILPINKNNNISIKTKQKYKIWQQYRLLNILIEQLPKNFTSVAWIDCDVILNDKDWIEKAEDLLKNNILIQLFNRANFLNKKKQIEKVKYSCGSYYVNKKNFDTDSWPGFAWACNLDFIKKYKIYDYWMWSSDLAILMGVTGKFGSPIFKKINKEMKDHYFLWAAPFYKEAKGSFGFLDVDAFHLWHKNDTNYKKRLEILKNFDPKNDIRIGENKCFEWCSNKPDLHKQMNDFCVKYNKYIPFL